MIVGIDGISVSVWCIAIAYILLGTHTRRLRVAQSLRLRLARRAFGVLGRAHRLVRGTQLGLLHVRVCDDNLIMRQCVVGSTKWDVNGGTRDTGR